MPYKKKMTGSKKTKKAKVQFENAKVLYFKNKFSFDKHRCNKSAKMGVL